jgi:hypothetical protein
MLKADYKEQYGYYCLMRLPGPGAIPKDGLDGVDFKEGYSLSGHHYWGHAIYNRKLTDEEVLHYDLEETALVVMD